MDKLTIMDKLCDDCRKELCETSDNEGNTGLFGFLETLKKGPKAGVDVNKAKALESAALHGHDECLDALIKAGADVNVKTCPFALAIKSGNQRCVELFLKAGGNVNSKFKTRERSRRWETNVLREAVKGGNGEIVRLLLDAGADVNFKVYGAMSPLWETALAGRCNILESLIKAGAKDRSSALTCALRTLNETQPISSYTKCVDLLIQAGAGVNCGKKEKDKQTPCCIATLGGFNEGLDLLIKSGADVNSGYGGVSPLMLAAEYGFYQCMELLIAVGVDVNKVDGNGLTAFVCTGQGYLDFRFEPQHSPFQKILPKINFIECGKILLRAGAKVNLTVWDKRLLNYFIEHFKAQREIYLFTYAAGETFEVSVDNPKNKNPKIPDYLMFKGLDQLDLKHLCRLVIRKHLLSVDPHEHLFGRIPRLGLPKPLSKYLLFNFSLED